MCLRAGLLPLALVVAAGVAPAQDARPNFLIIIGDDMTWTDVSALGHPDVDTPNLDRLASQGMRLTRVFTPAPMCAPTRMALYTGVYPVRNGGHPNHSQVHPGTRSLPHFLVALGYRVGLTGKRHVAPAACFPFEPLGNRRGALGLNRLPEFIASCGSDPWCVVVASNQPHSPWSKGDATAYPPGELAVPAWLVDTPQTRDALSRYYGEVTFLDGQVGRCLEALEDSGQRDRTLVMFLTEQGAGFPFAKWTLYDHGIRATALVRWPGKVAATTESQALISYVDVLPTLIHAAGGAQPEGLDGRSFLPVLLGGASTHHDAVFAVQTSRGISNGPRAYGIRAIRTQRHKLIRNLHYQSSFKNNLTAGKQGMFASWRGTARARRYVHRPQWELYDLEADPHELVDLSGRSEMKPILADLAKRLQSWMEQQGDLGHATEMDALNRQGRGRATRGREALSR